MKHLKLAIQFLTIIPVKIKGEISNQDLGKTLVFFPLVGLLIGWILCCGLVWFSFLPPLIHAAVLLAISVVITGALHLDGFADSCDGLYGMWNKEKALEIMKDSNIGAMGVVGLIVVLILKFSLFFQITKGFLWQPLLCMGAVSRWAQIFSFLNTKYPRKEGKAKILIEQANIKNVMISGIGVFLLCVVLLGILKALIVFGITSSVVFVFKKFVEKKISGMTGDTIGTVNEIAEITVLLISVCF